MPKKSPKSSDMGGTFMEGMEMYGVFQIYVGIVMGILFGLGALYGAYYFYTSDDGPYITTSAVVQADTPGCTRIEDNNVCSTKVKYTDKDGEEYEVFLKGSKRYTKDSTIKVEYVESNPENVEICCRTGNRIWGHALLAFALLMFLASGISFYLRNNKFYRKISGMQGGLAMMSRGR